MAKFEALEVALQLVRSVGKLLPQIRQHDPKMARQLTDALTSVPANFAEGSRRRGRDRLYHYSIADGSAAEVRVHLASSVALGYVSEDDTAQADRLADRCSAIAYGLMHPRR